MILATLLLSTVAAAVPVDETNYDVSGIDDVTRRQKIRALEQVKDALYEQLRGAVAESILALNGTESGTLMELPSLQELLKDPGRLQNPSDVPARRKFSQKRADDKPIGDVEEPVMSPEDEPAAHDDEEGSEASSPAPTPSAAEKDRRGMNDNAKYWYDFFNLGDVVNLHFSDQGSVQNRGKAKQETKNTEQALNKQQVVQRLQEWILQKQEEKRKILEWKNQLNADRELCPRWGRKKKRLHPCCRKCCKSSYLGCL